MKKLFTLIACLLVTMASTAQHQRLEISPELQVIAEPDRGEAENSNLSPLPYHGPVKQNSLFEDIIGNTRYDSQTNFSMQNRFYLYPDGTMGGVWTHGMDDPGYADRGTGYNFYDGTTWGPIPTQRLESVKCGWPTYSPLGPQGEMVISHHYPGFPCLMLTRSQKGTGTWTETEIPVPPDAVAVHWPDIVTSGPDHQHIHMLVKTLGPGSGGALYEGLRGAILYYRSLDGGVSWDIAGELLPQMTSLDYYGFAGDTYSWATPRGDTIAFVVGAKWTDTFVMVSYNNGITWEKIPILNNGNKMVPLYTPTEKFACCDGSVAMEMDKNGIFHVVFGRMFAEGREDGRYYSSETDGLIYWNSTMPMLHDSLYLDTLDANGQLLGYVVEGTGGDTIIDWPRYGVGMSSHPQITIEDDNIYVIWSALTVGNPHGNLNYRHIWSRCSQDLGQTWGDMVDLNGSILYMSREFVFPVMAKNTSADHIHFIYQTADIPGSANKDPNRVPVHDSFIEYRKEPKDTSIGFTDLGSPVSDFRIKNYPNPFSSTTTIEYDLDHPADVEITIVDQFGRKVEQMKHNGIYGINQFTWDAGSLPTGVYVCRISAGKMVGTKKMVIVR